MGFPSGRDAIPLTTPPIPSTSRDVAEDVVVIDATPDAEAHANPGDPGTSTHKPGCTCPDNRRLVDGTANQFGINVRDLVIQR